MASINDMHLPGDPDDPGDAVGRGRRWIVTIQVHIWHSVDVEAETEAEAIALASEEAQLMYGEDVFIYPDGVEVT
ncbi:MAG: hypothetical protein M3Y48_19860 [Actinomycetota bacterium]|nr:hypothetical protein [Actinomycetota bacterium]